MVLLGSATAGAAGGMSDVGGEWAGAWTSSTMESQGSITLNIEHNDTVIKGQGQLTTANENTPGCFENFQVSGFLAGERMNLVIASPGGDAANVSLQASSPPITGEYTVVSGACEGDSGALSLGRLAGNVAPESKSVPHLAAASPPGESSVPDKPEAGSPEAASPEAAAPEGASSEGASSEETSPEEASSEEASSEEASSEEAAPEEASPEVTSSESESVQTNVNDVPALQDPQFEETVGKDAYILKGANIRKGPGTENPIIAALPRGTGIHVRGKEGNWYAITARVNDETVPAWVYVPLVTFDKNKLDSVVAQSGASWQKPSQEVRFSDGSVLQYAGYTEDFLDVRQLFAQGDLSAIENHYQRQREQLEEEHRNRASRSGSMAGHAPPGMAGFGDTRPTTTPSYARPGLLHWLERGTLSIAQGDYENAVEYFSTAERIVDARQNRSKVASFFRNVGETIGEVVVGDQEIGEYDGEGYEKVLMLNYKSIAYLLRGERKAYNVTRRAIDWQQMEKEKFEEKLREIEKKFENKSESDSGFRKFSDLQLPGAFEQTSKKAASVPSAYVNPFGYYVAGMVQEYEGYSDWSLRDNARISYEKALELNPDSEVLQEAVKDMKSSPPSDRKLLHVVVGDGWAPEKRVLEYGIPVPDGEIPLKLPMYVPIENSVSRIEIRTPGGRRLATLSPVADIEAICLRHQKDLEPILRLRAITAVITSAVFRGVTTQETDSGFVNALFRILNQTRDELRAPDTRSWLSLPASIEAARVYIPKDLTSVRLISYSAGGQRLASNTVKLAPDTNSFVYARSLNNLMYTHSGTIPKWH